jgi:hypothetical protein
MTVQLAAAYRDIGADGLHRAAAITDDEYNRFREMANLLTTTYDKK